VTETTNIHGTGEGNLTTVLPSQSRRERPSTSAMHDLICAIIQDEASYDPVTNTWDVGKAATSIIAAFDEAPQSNVNECLSCKRMFVDGETCSRGGCPMGGDV